MFNEKLTVTEAPGDAEARNTCVLSCQDIGVAVAPEELLVSMPRTIERRPLEHGRFRIDLGWAYLRSNSNPALLRLLDYFDHRDL